VELPLNKLRIVIWNLGGRYGYQEVETDFITLLGECGAARYLLDVREDRQEYM